jgi:hypothetical protein
MLCNHLQVCFPPLAVLLLTWHPSGLPVKVIAEADGG